MPTTATASRQEPANPLAEYGQTVLVLQGGGALGAYQAGVYQALHEAGIEPDWIIGTSIGAINASLIAGNRPEKRVARLKQFWETVEHGLLLKLAGSFPIFGQSASTMLSILGGVPGFFEPNPKAHFGNHVKLGADRAGYYSTAPLQKTLSELVDFSQVNNGGTRLTVGAANVHSSAMRYFDSRDEKLNVKHVMASGALPPAFPAIRIDGELYWDGGILSNTPVEAVFDDKPRKNSLVFAVHLWNPNGPEPDSILKVANRQKDLQYSSRAGTHIARQRQIHRLRHIIAELAAHLPEDKLKNNFVREMAAYGCLTRMHVVRLLAPQVRGEDHAKDIDFSPNGIRTRWRAGYIDTQRVLEAEPWKAPVDPVEGFVLHEANAGVMQDAPSPSTTIPKP
ncbi:MAG: patatin-like phospholipase family protein [Rhizomicrobium sp.]